MTSAARRSALLKEPALRPTDVFTKMAKESPVFAERFTVAVGPAGEIDLIANPVAYHAADLDPLTVGRNYYVTNAKEENDFEELRRDYRFNKIIDRHGLFRFRNVQTVRELLHHYKT